MLMSISIVIFSRQLSTPHLLPGNGLPEVGPDRFLHTVHSLSGTAQVDQTEAGFRQPDAELQKPGITGQVGTARHAGVAPGKTRRPLPAPAQLLHVLRERPEASPPLSSAIRGRYFLSSGYTAVSVQDPQNPRQEKCGFTLFAGN